MPHLSRAQCTAYRSSGFGLGMPKTPLNNFDLNLAKNLRRCWSYWKSFISVNFFNFFCCLSVCKMTTTEFPSFSSCHHYPWGLQYTLCSSYSDNAIGYTYLYSAVMPFCISDTVTESDRLTLCKGLCGFLNTSIWINIYPSTLTVRKWNHCRESKY